MPSTVRPPLLAMLLFTAPLVHAGPVSYGALSSNDDGSTEIILDSLNKYDWLRWNVLAELTYDETLAAIALGGPYEGWRVAHNSEAQLFVDALLHPNEHDCETVDADTCAFTGSTVLTPLLGDSFVINADTAEMYWSDVAFFLTDNDLGAEVGFLEHSFVTPQFGFMIYKYNDWDSIVESDRYSGSGSGTVPDAIPWLLYRDAVPVPEPSTLGLLLAGVIGFGLRRRVATGRVRFP